MQLIDPYVLFTQVGKSKKKICLTEKYEDFFLLELEV